MIRAIKIDVEKKEVYVIDYDNNGLQGMYDAIGNGCDIVQIALQFDKSSVRQEVGDALWVDEEALFKGDNIKGGFKLGNIEQPYCNNGLIIGNINTEEGQECSDVTIPLEIIKKVVTFIDKEFFDSYEPEISVTTWK